jgi:arsenite methyltransferase
MKGESRESSSEARIELEPTYLELQAYIGTTKHMGGLSATEELVELCHISAGKYVLDVGCGVGATACYIAQRYGCRVVGVDISEGMIEGARQRARREGVEDQVEFRVADAQNLPFEDSLFDAVLVESVIAFIPDKGRVIREMVRVTKEGAYVGLNEVTWIKTPPPEELVKSVVRIWEVDPDIPTPEDWEGLMQVSGLQDIVARTYRFSARREFSEFRRYRFRDFWRMLTASLSLYMRSSAFRKYMKGRQRLPKEIWEYLGYGIYVGRK